MKQNYFDGWYLKHVAEEQFIAFIPGFHVDEKGRPSAFIQIVTSDQSYYVGYDYKEYKKAKNGQAIKIGNNLFSVRGIKIDIRDEEQGLNIKGKIKYKKLHPLKYSIMGPFVLVPFMECRHRVISMNHYLQGNIKFNGKWMDFYGGKGYIEGDRGCSFPNKYFWAQANQFSSNNVAIMVAAANIPIMGHEFTGFFAAIQYQGREIRLATYWGGKVIQYNPESMWIKQGKYLFCVDIINADSYQLAAPDNGSMTRNILESPVCTARFQLFYNHRKVFDLTSEKTSFEYDELS